jgi:hypothetical protein
MTDDGTEFGTADHETITTDGDEATTMTYEAGKLETHEAGTATGDDQVDGTVTVDGTKTNDEALTVTTDDEAID